MIKNAKLAKEIVVTAGNKIGVLARITKLLGDHGINIVALAGYAKEDKKSAEIMLVADDHLRAADALKKEKFRSVKERVVVVLDLVNKPGALKGVSGILAEGKIDIKHIYGTACDCGCDATLVLSTSNNEKALLTLKGKR